MKSITYEQIKDTASQSMVLFSAPWCAPCQNLKKQITDDMNVAICDIEENMEAAESFFITTVPTVLIFDNKEIKERAMGYIDCLNVIKTKSPALA